MFEIKFAQHLLQDGPMSFGFAILKVCFGTYGGESNVMCLNKLHKLLAVKFRGRVNYQLRRGSRPLEPHVNQAVDYIFRGSRWGNTGNMEAGGPVYNMIDMKGLTLGICPTKSINGDSIIEI